MSFILFLGTGQASQCVCSFLRKMGLKINPPWFFLLLFMNCSHVLPSLVFLKYYFWREIFMVEIFCFESILFDYFIWATLYYITENRNWLAKVFDVDATKFLCISVSRHVQTTWRRREEEREYSIFSIHFYFENTLLTDSQY